VPPDAEATQGRLELLGIATVPVGRVLEPVRVEIAGARDVALRVLLGHAEVHVEEQEVAFGSCLGAAAGQELGEPGGVNQLLVAGQTLDGSGRVGRPCGEPTVEASHLRVPEVGQQAGEEVDVDRVAIEHDVAGGDDVLGPQDPLDLGPVDTAEPGGRERRRARHVATARLGAEPPAVVAGNGAEIDDGEIRIAQTSLEVRGRDGRGGGERLGCSHGVGPSERDGSASNKKTPARQGSGRCGAATRTVARSGTPPALLGSLRTEATREARNGTHDRRSVTGWEGRRNAYSDGHALHRLQPS
jgi:hypothetical protein